MSATTSGFLKAYIEGLGLGISAYRDRAPEGATLPYVTISEGISVTPDPAESKDAGSAYQTGLELAQVDIWQQRKATTDRHETESYTLAPAIIRALHNFVPPGGSQSTGASPQVTYGVFLQGAVRLIELDNNLLHWALTLKVYRQL